MLLVPWRSARRRSMRWPTWVWAAGAWGWMAQAILQGEGGRPTALAALGPVANGLGVEVTGLEPSWIPQPVAGRAERVAAGETAWMVPVMVDRGGRWQFLSAEMRTLMSEAVEKDSGRAGWRQVVVDGSGEAVGGARDWKYWKAREGRPWRVDDAHLMIGNGTRSADGAIEWTGRPLAGDSLMVVLGGDGSWQPPTVAQLRALTEVVDYARSKTGMIRAVAGPTAQAPLASDVLESAYNQGIVIDRTGANPRS